MPTKSAPPAPHLVGLTAVGEVGSRAFAGGAPPPARREGPGAAATQRYARAVKSKGTVRSAATKLIVARAAKSAQLARSGMEQSLLLRWREAAWPRYNPPLTNPLHACSSATDIIKGLQTAPLRAASERNQPLGQLQRSAYYLRSA